MLGLGLNLTSITAALLDFVRSGLKMWLPFENSEILGEDVVTNGDFATDSDWTKGTGWTISSGKANSDGTQSVSYFRQDGIVNLTSTYKIEFTVSGSTSGTLNFLKGNGSTAINVTSNDTYTYYAKWDGSTGDVAFQSLNFVGSIDNVSVQEVTQIAQDKSTNNSNSATLYTGKALSFDGVNDYVDLGSQSMPNATEATFAFWVNPVLASGSSERAILTYGKTTAWFRGNNSISFYNLISDFVTSISIPDLSNEWHRLVITITDQDTVNVYIDGEHISTETAPTGISTTAADSYIGSYGAGRYLQGKLADFQIYDKAWTQADVTFDYDNPQHLITDNPSIVKTYGSEIVDDGGFDDASKWNANTGWTVSGGKASINHHETTALRQVLSVTKGKIYDLTFEISDYVEGAFQFGFNQFNIAETSSNLPNFTENGIYNYRVVSLGDNLNVYMYGVNASEFSIDNLSLKEETSLNVSNIKGYWHLSEGAGSFAYNSAVVLGSEELDNGDFATDSVWNKNNGADIDTTVSDALYLPNGGAFVTQTSVIESGKTYKYTVVAKSQTSTLSDLKLITGSTTQKTIEDIPVNYTTYTGVITSNGTSFKMQEDGDGAVIINSISLKEVSVGTAYDGNADDHDSDGTVLGATWVLQQPTIPQLGLMDWAKSTPVADEITLISDPNDPSKDVLDNDVRFREHSLNLDGSGYAEVADDDTLDFGQGAFSIDGWAKYTFVNSGSSSGNVIFINGGNPVGAPSGSFAILTNTSGGTRYVSFYVNGTELASNITSSVSDGAWFYFAGTRDASGNLKLYINDLTAVSQSQTGNTDETVSTNLARKIGRGTDATRTYKNLIDDVRLYDRELLADEIEQNYNAGLSQHKPGSAFSNDFSSDYGL